LAAQFLEKNGTQVLAANIRIFNTEIDLFCLSPAGELVVVEVKSQRFEGAWQPLVSEKQRQRIAALLELLMGCSGRSARAHLVAVNQSSAPQEIEIFEDFLAD